MAGESDSADRTHAATPRRLQQARDEGNLAVSREAAVLAGLVGAAIVLSQAVPAAAGQLTARLAVFLGRLDTLSANSPAEIMPAIRLACLAGMVMAAPFLAAALVAGVAPALLQTGFLLNLKALQPDIARVNPLAGLRRLLGLDSLVEAVKSVLKIAVLWAVVWMVVSGELKRLAVLPQVGIAGLGPQLAHAAFQVLLAVIAVQAAIAGFDLFWVRLRHARRLRMSREDLRNEARDSEGDPRVKARLRQLRAQRARKRMLAAVPGATVVITNPTHYAVALAYDRDTNAAPRVVAKGMDSMAARIREAARAHGVPMVANPVLARALCAIELDADIPADHFQAVAEIIAYVWKLNATVALRRSAT